MTGSRGNMSVCPMYSADDLKISNPDQYVHLVIREFLKMGEGEAQCCIQMPRGILLLQTVPGKTPRALRPWQRMPPRPDSTADPPGFDRNCNLGYDMQNGACHEVPNPDNRRDGDPLL
jgi:hypothetical protein